MGVLFFQLSNCFAYKVVNGNKFADIVGLGFNYSIKKVSLRGVLIQSFNEVKIAACRCGIVISYYDCKCALVSLALILKSSIREDLWSKKFNFPLCEIAITDFRDMLQYDFKGRFFNKKYCFEYQMVWWEKTIARISHSAYYFYMIYEFLNYVSWILRWAVNWPRLHILHPPHEVEFITTRYNI